jgi:hypothetical protein
MALPTRLQVESAKLTDFGASFWLLEDRSRKRRPRPLPATKSPIARSRVSTDVPCSQRFEIGSTHIRTQGCSRLQCL